jgi:glycosyltransferase involved in cell wall biosynthesis
MRIALVSNLFYPLLKGGAEKRYWEISKELVKRGHEVHIFTAQWPGTKNSEVAKGVNIHRFGPIKEALYDQKTGKRRIKPALLFCLEILKNFQPRAFDIIETSTFPFFHCFPVKFKSALCKIPTIFTVHEVWQGYWKDYLESSFKGSLGIWIEARVNKMPDHIITVSSIMKERICDSFGIDATNQTVISNGVNLSLGQKIAKEVDKDHNKIVYAGRLAEHKRVNLLIRAMSQVLKKNPKASLSIVGEGPEFQRISQLIKELDLTEKITLHGYFEHYSDVLREIASGSIFVLPSIREGQGIVLLEAMSVATPVIAVNYPGSGVLDIVEDRTNGLLVEPNSAKAISTAILQYWQDKSLQQHIKKNSHSFIQNYDWSSIAEQVEQTYFQLLKTTR